MKTLQVNGIRASENDFIHIARALMEEQYPEYQFWIQESEGYDTLVEQDLSAENPLTYWVIESVHYNMDGSIKQIDLDC
jgi:hypothetical protein